MQNVKQELLTREAAARLGGGERRINVQHAKGIEQIFGMFSIGWDEQRFAIGLDQ